MDVAEFILALIAMICGIGYIVTILVGKSTYLVVAIASSLFSMSRSVRNVTKAARAGFAVISSSKKVNAVVPQPPHKKVVPQSTLKKVAPQPRHKKVVPQSPPQKERVKRKEPRNFKIAPYANAIKNMEVIFVARGIVRSKDS